MVGNKKEYDLIFSLGEACSCTQALRASGLQFFSYPFDWLFGSDYIERCKILANKFDRFIEKDDLEYTYSERSIKCNAYYNKYNDLTFNHDFSIEIPFDEMYPEVKKKYERRINRLLNNIENAKKVLIVYIEAPLKNHVEIDNETIQKGFEIIKNSFSNPEKFDFLYISNKNSEKNTVKFSESATKIELNYKDCNSIFDHAVKEKSLKKILKNLYLKNSLKIKIRMKILKNIINFIPIKKVRKDLRKKYHVK